MERRKGARNVNLRFYSVYAPKYPPLRPRQMQEAEKCYIFVTAALLTFLYHVHIIEDKG